MRLSSARTRLCARIWCPPIERRWSALASPSLEGIAGGGNALATRSDYTALLPAIAVPALVVEGQDDTVYPYPVAVKIKAAIPGADYTLIPGAGHASMFQRPDVANDAIGRWLSASGSAGR